MPTFVYATYVLVREGLKKKWVGGVSSGPIFRFFLFLFKHQLKTLKLPKNPFKTNLFFSIFGGGDPPSVRSWSDGRLEIQTSLEKPSDTSQMTRIIQNSFHGM